MNDGGPAFSRPYSTNGTAEDGPSPGMSLRDWFAGQALSGMPLDNYDPDDAAMDAYNIADAMLAEREKR